MDERPAGSQRYPFVGPAAAEPVGIGMSSIISLIVLNACSFEPKTYPHSRGIAAQY